MRRRWLYIVLFLLSVWTMPVRGAMTTEGTEFWVTFMTNFEHSESSGGLQLKLLASAQKAATVTISNPQTGWQKSFSVGDHGIAEYTIPAGQAYLTGDEKAEKKGLCVTSTAPISLYASNYADATNDATGVLPLTALSGYYIIQTYESTQYPKEFAIVATENNTTVIITPRARTLSGRTKNTPFTIKLNKGEACQVRSSDEANDFSGTTIQANHAIAVFAGHQCANVSAADDWCDHIVEQTIPVSMWGKHFAVTKTIGQYTNRVQVTAQQDNTAVSVNGTLHVTLNALQTYEFQIEKNDISCYIETSLPAACYLYTEGGRRNNKVGDPSSVYISPIEQFIKEITFATLKTARSEHNYVNIVTPTATADRTMLDGAVINRTFTPLAGNEQLSYVRMEVSHGTHTLSNAEGGLTAYVYGLGDGESYAYMVGSSTYPLDAQILVDGKPGAQTEMEIFCRRHTFTFAPQVNMDYSSVTWDFGDGTSLVQEKPQHIYTSAGDYVVTMTITGETETKTVSTTLHLDEQLHDTLRIALCEGDKYTYHSKEYTAAGSYPVTLISKDGCDSIVVLEITTGKTYLTKDTRYLATGQTIRWRNQRIATPGTYRDTVPTILGCDSIFELTLIQTDAPKVQYDTLCYEPTYLFMGHEYPIPPVDAYKDKDYVNYNLEYRDKESCRKYIMHLAIVPNHEEDSVAYDTIPHGTVYQWRGKTYTESGTYTEDEELGCHSVKHYTLHLVVKPYPIVEEKAVLCLTGSYDFRGTELTEPGVYSDTVFSAVGIGAVYRVELTDNRSSKDLYVEDVPSYDFNGKTLTTSGTYRDTLVNAAGCDSIVTLYLGIDGKCTVTEEINRSLCEGESIEWNLQTCVPGNDYNYTTVSAAGCDSTVILHLHPLAKKEKTITTAICEGDYLRVGEERLTEEGTHVVHLTSAEGCDSIVTVHLTVLEPLTGDTTAFFCEGKSFKWHETDYTTAGDYPYTYVSKVQPYCDSIVTLHLSQVGATDSIETVTICAGETHQWHDRSYTATTTETETLTNAAGCDSVCTLHLTVLEPLTGDTTAFFCEGKSFKWHEKEYTSPGNYTHPYTSTVKPYCDSIVTLRLSQVEATDSIETVTICAGETHIWHGREYTESTTETETLTNAAGCDSICTLHLTVLEPLTGDTTAFFCEGKSFKWHETDYTTAGDYPYTYVSKVQPYCDSIVTLHLQVYEPIEETVLPPVALCYGESYPWLDGKEYTTSQSLSYTLPSVVTGCDSVVSVELTIWPEPGVGHEYLTLTNNEPVTWNGLTYTSAGDYLCNTLQTSHGCDSTAWLHLSDKPVYDSTEVQTVCAGDDILWHERTLTPTETDYVFTHRITGEETDTLITLTVTVHPSYPNEEFSASICEGESYPWDGTDYTESGDHTRKYKTAHGCDSIVTLHLTVHKAIPETVLPPVALCYGESYPWLDGKEYTTSQSLSYTLPSVVTGCDSVVSVKLTIWPEPGVGHEYLTLTNNEPVTWNGVTYTSAGEYFCNTLQTSHGCDSTAWLHLSDKPVYDSTEVQTVCAGDDILWHERTLTPTETDHVFTHRITGEETDTLITLTVTVHPSYPNEEFSASICEGESYPWDGTDYTESGDHTRKYKTVHGCDSIVTLHLTVHKRYDDTEETRYICPGSYTEWNEIRYDEEKDYTVPLKTVAGCDSIVTLHLKYYPEYDDIDDYGVICEGKAYSWEGTDYTEPGDYTKTLQTVHGCDSVVTLHLTMNPRYDGIDDYGVICAGETYPWEGTDYTEDGEYTKTLQTVHGCDSVVTLHLTVHPRYDNINDYGAICEGETYPWEGTEYAEEGDYTKTLQTVHGCDSVVTLHLTVHPTYADPADEHTMYKNESYEWKGKTYTETGTYTKTYESVHGCDSVVTLHLTVLDKPVLNRDSTVTICEGETFVFYDTPYTTSTEQTVLREGRQADTLVTLHLTVLPRVYAQWTDSVLEGKTYTIGDTAILHAGDYTVVLQTVQGCDSVVSLHLETVHIDKESLTVEVDEPCADEGILEVRFSAFGVANRASFHFDEKARNAGLRDTIVSLGKEGAVTIPFHARAGKYSARVELLFRDQVAHRMEVPFVFLFPSSVIEQHWNDVVAALTHDYNGGYDFVAFQWYENGNKLSGETRSYLYRPLIMGAEYSAMLTERDGTRLMCCPIIASPQTDISVYPTVSEPARLVHCHVSESAQMELCDATGRLIHQCRLEPGDNIFQAPDIQGIYIIRVQTERDRTKVLKLFVQ